MSYVVVFTGEIRKHFERRRAIAALGSEFGFSFSQIKALMASSRSQLKKSSDRADVCRFMHKLWNSGWHSQLFIDVELLHCTRVSSESGEPELPVVLGKLHTTDPDISISAPRSWHSCDNLNPSAVIQAGNIEANRYLIVLAQDRSELPAELTLADYGEAQMKQCLGKVAGGELLYGPELIERAWQTGILYEMRANIGRDSVQYLVAFFQSTQSFYTLFLWTDLQGFTQSKTEFIQVVATFQSQG
ncbi:hypothetical protein [Microbulbifer sp. GL-2]|uniref:hypothetical protein n=1 Tax=Microbulbifer sp. GL-2 TaxID=2591606 RepID=UPI00116585A0|nr:hypothetical protein [Microbulbifer sp. GL-2]BBM01002.1 hypothetical protein GL2_10760 [Microbulbifer sp. GL-2]